MTSGGISCGAANGTSPQGADIPVFLNLGCGTVLFPPPWVNVDAWGNPDVKWDLNVVPYPFPGNHADHVYVNHVLEHLPNWWEAFKEMVRVTKPGGSIIVGVPHEGSSTALSYRDHVNVFSKASWHGIAGYTSGSNTWAATEEDTVPVKMTKYFVIPYKEWNWILRFPRLARFAERHLRNVFWGQEFHFIKISR